MCHLAYVRSGSNVRKSVAVAQMLAGDIHCPPTTSMGRMFDAAAGLLGIKAVMAYEGQAAMAMVDVAGIGREISLALVDDVAVGDYVIVHVGYALTRLDPEEAGKTLALFAEMGEGSWSAANAAEP